MLSNSKEEVLVLTCEDLNDREKEKEIHRKRRDIKTKKERQYNEVNDRKPKEKTKRIKIYGEDIDDLGMDY